MNKHISTEAVRHPRIDKQDKDNTDVFDKAIKEFKSTIDRLGKKYEILCDKNIKLISALKFYAEADWKTLSTIDRGMRAKRILEELKIEGKNKNGQTKTL